jgi:hypothetical protein
MPVYSLRNSRQEIRQLSAGTQTRARSPRRQVSAPEQIRRNGAVDLELFAAQSWLLLNRASRGLRMDPRSLRNLARLAEQLAKDEERAA